MPTALPDDLTLRPIDDRDLPFLRRLYASTRQQELAPVPWSEEQKEAFLRFQFDAQHAYYQEQFPGAAFDLVLRGEEAIGRLYVDRREEEIRLIDVALLPEHRGRGIGGALMRRLLAEARGAGKKVRIHVEHNNPAQRLYRRLGFRRIEDQGVYHLMEWSPENEEDES
ncbi:MAG: N-acetyltransferase [Acidobacteria bacterium]|nr:MAG: N-acetyltransferase [Acidobacteriota bacterium]